MDEKWYKKCKTNTADESKRIIQTVAENYIPVALRQFLSILIKKQLPHVFLGQAMISNARARSSIVPIPFALGVELDNQFGSRWLFES